MSAQFRNQLRSLRENQGLTQAEVAAILGVSPPRISEWERGVRTPKPLTQEAIIAKLKKKKKKRKRK
jgi:transcriptional regulator with XRE-family HTH domain